MSLKVKISSPPRPLGAVILLTAVAKNASLSPSISFKRPLSKLCPPNRRRNVCILSFSSNPQSPQQTFLFFLVIAATSVAANLLQTGVLVIPDKVAPNFSRINPFKNFARLFSFGTLGQLGFALFKITILALVLIFSLRRDFETIVSLPNGDVLPIVLFIGAFLKRLAFLLCGTLLALGVLDYAVKRFFYERQLRMTLQELKEEIKEESGNQQAKGKRNAMRRSALSSVPAVTSLRPALPTSRFQEKDQKDGPSKKRKH